VIAAHTARHGSRPKQPVSASSPHPLLHGPIPATLLWLSLPNVLALVTTVLVGIAETSYIGLLGVEPLAAMALVFPFVMLTQMMSSGAMGGGVSSAVSRALGAGNVARAQALALHAVLIGAIVGIAFALLFLMFGPRLYAFLGGRERVLAEAIGYSTTFFLFAAVAIWLNNSLLSVVRGTGNMVLPSAAIFAVSTLQIAIGGALGLGLGPFPQLGMPGVALGQALATASGAVFALWYLASGRARVTLRLRGIRLQWDMFADILKVGALACLSPLQSVLTILIFTALVARFGVSTLAGYGIGVRLEFLLVPIAFGIGVASVPMVGMAIGANNIERARRVAWTAGAMSAAMLGVIGAAVAIAPDLWASIFTRDAAVLAETRNYLRIAGPGFAFLGLGLTLYFASQGSGKVLGPVIAGTLRLVLVALGGLWLAHINADAQALFALVAISMAAYGIAVAVAVRMTPWRASSQLPH
jgi:putative MATE family efflux protein